MEKSRWRGPQKSGFRPRSKPDTTCALFRDGQFLTQSIQSDKKFLALAGTEFVSEGKSE